MVGGGASDDYDDAPRWLARAKGKGRVRHAKVFGPRHSAKFPEHRGSEVQVRSMRLQAPGCIGGFVEGCLERIAEDEAEGRVHPDDIRASHFRAMWFDPVLASLDRRDLVMESLKAECEIHNN